MALKSPANSHGPLICSAISFNSWKNSGLDSSRFGPWTFDSQNLVAFDSDSKRELMV
jgi:hypothetical protein